MRAVFVLVLSFIVSGCAGFAYDKFTVKDLHIEQSSRLAEVRIVGVNEKSVTVEVKNISNSPITIDWSEAQIAGKPVYLGAFLSQVESAGRYIEPSIVPANRAVSKMLVPAENVEETAQSDGYYRNRGTSSYNYYGNYYYAGSSGFISSEHEISKRVYNLDYPVYIIIKVRQGDYLEDIILDVDAEYITIIDCGKGKDENGKYMQDRKYELENIIYENGGYLPDGSRVKNVRTIANDKDCK